MNPAPSGYLNIRRVGVKMIEQGEGAG